MVKAGRARAADEVVSGTESVRERILNTARELFYREGARSVGVDTVVAQSGRRQDQSLSLVPLERRADRGRDRSRSERSLGRLGLHRRAQSADAREQLRAQLAGIAKFVSSPKYRGCPFMNVTVEFADDQHPARLVAREVMEELRRRVRALVDKIGVREPAIVTDQIVMLVDGAFSGAQVFGKDGPQQLLVTAADALIDAQKK